jgi:FdhE protein
MPGGGEIFLARADRFEQLARGHSMGGYLGLMAQVARVQAQVLGRRIASPPPAQALAASREYGMPPLAATSHRRDSAWSADIRELLDLLREAPAARAAAPAIAGLAALDDTALDEAADRLLAGTSRDDEAAAVPFLGAALQVYFTRLAATLQAKDVEGCDVATICPACASRPVASMVRIDPNRANLRYLSCSLCHTEWNLPRITCSTCEKDKGLQYFGLEDESGKPANAAWSAEACDECKTYLKIFHQEKDPHLDPVADDLASLALDVLVDERGFARSGPNLLFHPGGG